MISRLALPLVLLIGLIIPSTALAASESEPNDGIEEFDGPLAAATDYDANLATAGDQDWFAFYTSGAGDVTIKMTNLNDGFGCCDVPNADLLDDTGGYLNELNPSEGTTEEITFSAPGAGKYYLLVEDARPGDRYRLRLSGPIGDGPAARAPTQTPNDNPDANSAFGPLEGDVLYGGRLDVSGEEDWFCFYTAGAGTFHLEMTNSNDAIGCCDVPNLDLLDGNGEYLNELNPGENRIERLAYQVPGPGKYLIQVEDANPGDRYQLELTPASIITSTPPPAPPPEPGPPACNDGIDNDGDGQIDFPVDAGCSSESDNDESGGNSGNSGDGEVDADLDVRKKQSKPKVIAKLACIKACTAQIKGKAKIKKSRNRTLKIKLKAQTKSIQAGEATRLKLNPKGKKNKRKLKKALKKGKKIRVPHPRPGPAPGERAAAAGGPDDRHLPQHRGRRGISTAR